jgi:hypothetical protein
MTNNTQADANNEIVTMVTTSSLVVPPWIGLFDQFIYHQILDRLNQKPNARSMIVTAQNTQ